MSINHFHIRRLSCRHGYKSMISLNLSSFFQGEYEVKMHPNHGVIVYGGPNENPIPQIRPLYPGIDPTARQSAGERPPISEELQIPAEADTIEYVHRKDSYNPYTPFGSGYKTSFVLNGRGRGDGNFYPLHRFFVTPGGTYR